jgi:hypothetical protein
LVGPAACRPEPAAVAMPPPARPSATRARPWLWLSLRPCGISSWPP